MRYRLILILLLCSFAASLSVMRAAATSDEPDVASGDAMLRVTSTDGTSVRYGLFSSSFAYGTSGTDANHTAQYSIILPVSILGDHTYVYNISLEETYVSATNYITSQDYFGTISILRGTSYSYYPLNNDAIDFDGVSVYRSVSNSSYTNSGFVRSVNVSLIIDDPSITSITIQVPSHVINRIYTKPISIIDISNATLDDVLLQLVKLTNTTSSGTNTTSDAIYDAIQSLGMSLSESEWQNAEAIRTSLSAVQEAVAQMSEGMEDAVESGVKSAVKEFFEELKQEATEAFNKAVEDLSDVIPVDISAFSNTFNTVYNSVSHHDTNFTFNFPAGTVTLMGNTYTFWQRQSINITDVYNSSPYFRMLMFPLRFVFVYGFIKYLLHWFNKLEKLVTLHTGGGE